MHECAMAAHYLLRPACIAACTEARYVVGRHHATYHEQLCENALDHQVGYIIYGTDGVDAMA
jgi:hypothetical protein